MNVCMYVQERLTKYFSGGYNSVTGFSSASPSNYLNKMGLAEGTYIQTCIHTYTGFKIYFMYVCMQRCYTCCGCMKWFWQLLTEKIITNLQWRKFNGMTLYLHTYINLFMNSYIHTYIHTQGYGSCRQRLQQRLARQAYARMDGVHQPEVRRSLGYDVYVQYV